MEHALHQYLEVLFKMNKPEVANLTTVFFAGALFSLWMVGPYEEVVRVAREHEHHNDVRADINDEQNDDGSLIATPSQQTDDKIEDKN